MIRVVLVDDQTLVRQGIRSLLELSDRVRVVAEASDGQEGLQAVALHRPDVVLLDLRMPVLDGIGTLRALSRAGFFPPTLILTTFDDDERVLDALRAGAKGYLLKDVTLAQLVEAIEILAAGGTLIQPAVTERLIRGLTQLHKGDSPTRPYADAYDPEELTDRETEILRLLAGGYNNREVGSALGISEGTVKNHVSSILSKLGVRDRTRAVLKALELGLI
ncbi:Transcriptional regulatory protein DegU [Calidithermus terrae]|uniref:Transcriptional regulatory protein DegU n=1 Tax=Calidithermus terrae TaxID=1408545 RepID=A0A399EHJ0_9DEIN|nr:response regulator transcription factor [Calidithermus terrae]RIH83146.1 Transcriptional regulatory protein DegU [Calidithermus terrae]